MPIVVEETRSIGVYVSIDVIHRCIRAVVGMFCVIEADIGYHFIFKRTGSVVADGYIGINASIRIMRK